jgi:chromosomal replication initiator protein
VTVIWDEAKVRIRRQVGEENFATYFEKLRLVSESGPEVELEVDDEFFGFWVQEHYSDLLESTLTSVRGEPTTVRITTCPGTLDMAMGETLTPLPTVPKSKTEAPIAPLSADPTPDTGAFPTSRLDPHYQFDTFVVGAANEMAHAAAVAVAQKPARAFNPLFIYGGTGLGKTHLLHAVGHQLKARERNLRVVCVSAEEFTNQVIRSIQQRGMETFRTRYRTQCDVLLVDDVHVLAGKERTQEEFFHTFNALHHAQKQIILTSDRTPQEIPQLEDRLRSRFQWGLITDIKAPQFETRVAILQSKAEREGIALPDPVAFYLAKLVRANVRELEGALIRLSAYAGFRGVPLTVEFAGEVLRDLVSEQSLSIDGIIKLVAEHYDVKSADLKGRRRHRAVARPRAIAMFLCRKHTQSSFPTIGKGFGGKDHSTVITACRKIEKSIEDDHAFRTELDAIERKLPG